MASLAENVEVPNAPAAVQLKFGIVQQLMMIVVAVLLSVLLLTGTIYYLAKSGRLAGIAATSTASVVPKVEPVIAPATHVVVLEPMVVNLADEGGKTYLRLGLTLRVVDPEIKKGEKPKEEKPKETKGISAADAAVRDTALEVLGRQTAGALLAADGKERLKTELKAAIVQHNPDLKVSDVFFTEFLVQR